MSQASLVPRKDERAEVGRAIDEGALPANRETVRQSGWGVERRAVNPHHPVLPFVLSLSKHRSSSCGAKKKERPPSTALQALRTGFDKLSACPRESGGQTVQI